MRPFFLKFPKAPGRERIPWRGASPGTSLVSVLVSIGVAGIVIALSSVAYRNLSFERNLIQSKNSYREVEGVLKNMSITSLRAKIAAGDCGSAVMLNDTIANMSVQASGRIVLQTTNSALPKKLQPLKDAAERCANPVLPGSTGNTFRFCLQFSPRPGARKGSPDSFSGSKDTFAEIQATMLDFTTGQPITCAQFNASPRKSGFILTTGLYWVSSSYVGPVPNSNIGFVYVPGS